MGFLLSVTNTRYNAMYPSLQYSRSVLPHDCMLLSLCCVSVADALLSVWLLAWLIGSFLLYPCGRVGVSVWFRTLHASVCVFLKFLFADQINLNIS